MRYLVFCSCVAGLVACSPGEKQPAADTAAKPADTSMAMAAPAPAPAPAAVALSDFAGEWSIKATTEKGDNVVDFRLNAGADSTAWTFTFAKRKPIPVRITARGGDSLVLEAGPYESVLRKGVQVTTNNVLHLQGGKLTGTTVAHYKTNKPDSVVNLTVEGTR
jgi:hypothetical protein